MEIIARVIRTRPYLNGVRSGTRFLATSGVVIVVTPYGEDLSGEYAVGLLLAGIDGVSGVCE